MSETPQVDDVWERYGKRFCCEKVGRYFSTFREEGVLDCEERWLNAVVSISAKLIERDGKAVE